MKKIMQKEEYDKLTFEEKKKYWTDIYNDKEQPVIIREAAALKLIFL